MTNAHRYFSQPVLLPVQYSTSYRFKDTGGAGTHLPVKRHTYRYALLSLRWPSASSFRRPCRSSTRRLLAAAANRRQGPSARTPRAACWPCETQRAQPRSSCRRVSINLLAPGACKSSQVKACRVDESRDKGSGMGDPGLSNLPVRTRDLSTSRPGGEPIPTTYHT